MWHVLLIGLVAVVGGLLLGRVLRPRQPRVAHVFQYGAHALARLLAVAVLVRSAFAVLEEPDAIYIGLAVLLLLLASYAATTAALMLYVAVTGRTEFPEGPDHRS